MKKFRNRKDRRTKMPNEIEKITRLEVIENGERKYVKYNCKIVESIQDGGRTLKLFINL